MLEVKGQVYLVKGKHLLAVRFEDMTELGQIIQWAEKNGFEPYFDAKATRNADVVIGAVQDALARPEMQIQSSAPPECPIHHKPLKSSNFGGWYCPRKIGNEFCPVSVTKDGHWKGVPS